MFVVSFLPVLTSSNIPCVVMSEVMLYRPIRKHASIIVSMFKICFSPIFCFKMSLTPCGAYERTNIRVVYEISFFQM